ncbi:MAG: SH3 domain-containing protein [Acidobacteria bacterium]|nr:SH3 domain-containing protein [Acidobacteriota bacterium]
MTRQIETIRSRIVDRSRATLVKRQKRLFQPTRIALVPLFVAMALAVSSCQTSSTQRSLKGQEELHRAITRSEMAIRDLEEENGRQKLQSIEQRALIKQLEQRLLSQHQMLDDAIQEVVRVKAKQRSLESRAEAASELAEAEIALKALRDRLSDANRPKLANAERLLVRANEEFNSQNFGGVLYLVSQTKSQIKTDMLRLAERDRGERMEGEIPFAIPLQLIVNTRGNLRIGPGRKFRVLVTLEAGTPITGYSLKNSWLRVESDQGRVGWIHRSLVSAN